MADIFNLCHSMWYELYVKIIVAVWVGLMKGYLSSSERDVRFHDTKCYELIYSKHIIVSVRR